MLENSFWIILDIPITFTMTTTRDCSISYNIQASELNFYDIDNIEIEYNYAEYLEGDARDNFCVDHLYDNDVSNITEIGHCILCHLGQGHNFYNLNCAFLLIVV